MSEFKYNLPEELIAQYPPKVRGTSNLLVLDRESGDMDHRKYFNVPEYINSGDVVVLNETKVLNSRTYFVTPSGKRVEVLFLEDRGGDVWYCLIGRVKNVRDGDILVNESSEEFRVKAVNREGNGYLVKFIKGEAIDLFNNYGHTPLPPYMKREDSKEDMVRYNTVFSSIPGAVAAPTASLNLTDDIIREIESKGARIVKIELKVGWGTFAPIREENIEEHKIHEEYIHVSKESAAEINNCIDNGGKVWAFGTTVARTLESVAYQESEGKRYHVREYFGYTNLYVYPGYNWKVVNGLITNFHQPESTLILLVSSFAGKENIKRAYEEAITKKYKFLSYGDSMLIK